MRTQRETPGIQMHIGTTMGRSSKKGAIRTSRREDAEETNSSDTLILNFQHPELWENEFLLFKPPSLWYCVMAALID